MVKMSNDTTSFFILRKVICSSSFSLALDALHPQLTSLRRYTDTHTLVLSPQLSGALSRSGTTPYTSDASFSCPSSGP